MTDKHDVTERALGWMLRYAADEAVHGSVGVLYVLDDDRCSYVTDLDSVFPEAFVEALTTTLEEKKDHMVVVERNQNKLCVHAYPRSAAAEKLATLSLEQS